MSLFPEVDAEIKEINNNFESFKKDLLRQHKEYVCLSMDEAIEFENETCKHCTKYSLNRDNAPTCDIIVEFIANSYTPKIIDKENTPVCVEHSSLRDVFIMLPP